MTSTTTAAGGRGEEPKCFQTVQDMKDRINSMIHSNRWLEVSDKTLSMFIDGLIDEQIEMVRQDLKAYARNRLFE